MDKFGHETIKVTIWDGDTGHLFYPEQNSTAPEDNYIELQTGILDHVVFRAEFVGKKLKHVWRFR